MKKILFPIAVLCSAMASAQKPIFTQSKIESARVYTNGAELKHKAMVQIPSGTSEIVITNVANYLNEGTVQISVPKYVTVMSMQFSNAYVEEYDNNEDSPLVKPVKDELKKKEAEHNLILNQLSSAKKSVELLDKNQSMSNAQNFSVTELSKLLDYYSAKRTELNNQIDVLEEKDELMTEEIEKLKNQLSFNASRDTSISKGKLIINVMSSQAATIPLDISYLSAKAFWNPSYDLRIDKMNAPIQTVFKAQVQQNTGIDWKDVKLSLTSATANQNTKAPELNPWFVDYVTNYAKLKGESADIGLVQSLQGQVPGLNISTGSGQPGLNETTVVLRGVGSINGNVEPLYVIDGVPMSSDRFNALSPDEIANVTVVKDAGATAIYGNRGANGVIQVTTKAGMGVSNLENFTDVSESQLSVTYNLEIPYTILSNNKQHSVALKELSIPAEYNYVSVPKYDTSAYLTATIKDYAQYNLLPGEANVIFEGMYVGKTNIRATSSKEGMRLSLGKDDNISITRKKVNDKSGTKMLSSRKQEDVMYEINVRNNKKESISIIVEDQIPISSNTDIEITLTDKDGATTDVEKGKLTWNINLKPNETKKIRFGYQIKSAKDKAISTK